MYEVDNIDEVYESVESFVETVENLSYGIEDMERYVESELSPAMIEAEEMLESAERNDLDIEEPRQEYREARASLYNGKRELLKEEGLDVDDVHCLGRPSRRFAYGMVRGEVCDSIL